MHFRQYIQDLFLGVGFPTMGFVISLADLNEMLTTFSLCVGITVGLTTFLKMVCNKPKK